MTVLLNFMALVLNVMHMQSFKPFSKEPIHDSMIWHFFLNLKNENSSKLIVIKRIIIHCKRL